MNSIIACHDCDLLQKTPQLPEGARAKCIRCGATVHQRKRNSIERTLALAIAGLLLLILANSFPFLSMKIGEQIQETTLLTGIKQLYAQDMRTLAFLVFITTFLAPLVQILCMLYLLVPLQIGRVPRHLAKILRFLERLQPWSMMEVFMIGILVSIVKLAKMAKIIPGISIAAFFALIIVLSAMTVSLDSHLLWEKWGEQQ